MPPRQRKVWLDLLPSFEAQRELKEGDLSLYKPQDVYNLVLLATGDPAKAKEVKMREYERQLDRRLGIAE